MLDIDYSGDVLTAKLSGEIDHHSAAVIRKRIDAKTETVRPKVLDLDFEGVQFMDSSGIGLIMGRYRQMSLLGGRLRVMNIPPHLEKLFKLSGIGVLGVLN